MAQFTYRARLRSSHWPMLSANAGRTIIDPRIDDHAQIPSRSTGSEAQLNLGHPQVVYMENVLPIAEGLASIGYEDQIQYLTNPHNIYRLSPHKGFITRSAMSFDDGTIIANPINLGADFSVANLHRNHYAFKPLNSRFYKIDEFGGMELITTCLPQDTLLGILEANNFVIAYNEERIYWGNIDTNEELDFEPSLTTLAGSSIPLDLKGPIVAVYPVDNGFLIYTTRNVIWGEFNVGKVHCPWRFREVDSADGISDRNHVAWSHNSHFHYAWTNSGIQRIEGGRKATKEFPNVSEFLAGTIIEDYEGLQNDFTTTDTEPTWSSETQTYANVEATQLQIRKLNSPMDIKVRHIGDQYLTFSYGGIGRNDYEYVLVYDFKLERWGKLKARHQDVLELVETPLLFNFGLITSLGQVISILWETCDSDRSGVLILGKYQLDRQNVCTAQSIEIEQVEQDADFDVYWMNTYDGYSWVRDHVPAQTIVAKSARRYHLRKTGKNHSLKLIGAFTLTSLILTFTSHGNR